MLLNVQDDREFQAYLDVMEQRLHYHKFPLICAGIRLQMSRGGVAAQSYMHQRGEPALLRHYKQIFKDVYTAAYHQAEDKAARTGLSNFMRAQLTFLQARAAIHVSGISQSVADDIRDIVMQGVRQGLSNQTIASRLYKQIPEFSRGRAARIARTETHTAAMTAMYESVKFRAVPVKTKTWWTANDERVRESHADLHGVTIPFADAFDAATGSMLFPGDDSLGAGAADIVNCRCTLLYHT